MTVEWKPGRYVGTTARLGPKMELYVGYDATRNRGDTGPAYKAIVFGNTLTKRFNTEAEGKAAAIKTARRLLTEALAKLDD